MQSIRDALHDAVSKILRPIVRLLLRHGISHSEFTEISKQVFIDVAYNDFAIPNRKKTVSRAAVITGLSRKEVLRVLNTDNFDEKKTVNRASRVVGGWLQDEEFRDQQGAPLTLPLKGEHASFETLVKKYSGDITSRAVLDELVRIGSVQKTKTTVELVTQGYIPQDSEIDQLGIGAISAADLLHTINANLEHKDAKRFQRQLLYTDLPESVRREFQTLSAKKSLALLIELNEWLGHKKRNLTDNEKSEPLGRTGLGIYFIENDVEGDND